MNPNIIYVPTYDPFVVFAPPRPGFFIGGAIRFGPAITIGAGFLPFGWVGAGFGWREHTLLIDRQAWGRTGQSGSVPTSLRASHAALHRPARERHHH